MGTFIMFLAIALIGAAFSAYLGKLVGGHKLSGSSLREQELEDQVEQLEQDNIKLSLEIRKLNNTIRQLAPPRTKVDAAVDDIEDWIEEYNNEYGSEPK